MSAKKQVKKATVKKATTESKKEISEEIPEHNLKLEYDIKVKSASGEIVNIKGSNDFPLALYGDFKLESPNNIKNYLDSSITGMVYALVSEHCEDLYETENKHHQYIQLKC
jgi:hypothetical protein